MTFVDARPRPIHLDPIDEGWRVQMVGPRELYFDCDAARIDPSGALFVYDYEDGSATLSRIVAHGQWVSVEVRR